MDGLVTHRYSFAQAAEAFAYLLADRTRALGVVLTYESMASG